MARTEDIKLNVDERFIKVMEEHIHVVKESNDLMRELLGETLVSSYGRNAHVPPRPQYPGERFVQTKNPRTRGYVLIDRDRGAILAHSEPDKPFEDAPIIKPRERGEYTTTSQPDTPTHPVPFDDLDGSSGEAG